MMQDDTIVKMAQNNSITWKTTWRLKKNDCLSVNIYGMKNGDVKCAIWLCGFWDEIFKTIWSIPTFSVLHFYFLISMQCMQLHCKYLYWIFYICI